MAATENLSEVRLTCFSLSEGLTCLLSRPLLKKINPNASLVLFLLFELFSYYYFQPWESHRGEKLSQGNFKVR